MSIESIAQEVVEELERAEAKFGPFNSSHEGYAVILEELDELWEVVRLSASELRGLAPTKTLQERKRKDMMRAEAIQVAAMAMRFIKCICDQDKSDGQ